jgi:hypothetical protein
MLRTLWNSLSKPRTSLSTFRRSLKLGLISAAVLTLAISWVQAPWTLLRGVKPSLGQVERDWGDFPASRLARWDRARTGLPPWPIADPRGTRHITVGYGFPFECWVAVYRVDSSNLAVPCADDRSLLLAGVPLGGKLNTTRMPLPGALPVVPLLVPFLLDVLLLGSLLTVCIWATLQWRVRKRGRMNLCARCGYPLGGSGVCPECGCSVPIPDDLGLAPTVGTLPKSASKPQTTQSSFYRRLLIVLVVSVGLMIVLLYVYVPRSTTSTPTQGIWVIEEPYYDPD